MKLWTRIVITGAALAFWFWTQSLIGARGLPEQGIGDGLHAFTESWNRYLLVHSRAADGLLIVSSAVIDLLGVFLLLKWILRGAVRPFLGLVIVLGLRQIMQALVALPAPPNLIWRYPGFPSLLVTYGVANDYFFSGHTAIAVLGALELARGGRLWASLGVAIVIFEILAVLALRAHYTMDIFTGLVTALFAFHVADLISRWFNHRQLQRSR
jgi:hypothetical protein